MENPAPRLCAVGVLRYESHAMDIALVSRISANGWYRALADQSAAEFDENSGPRSWQSHFNPEKAQ